MDSFADVVLPLPLPGSFTYFLPPEMADGVTPGCRVIVPFGARKLYTGVVIRVHHDRPVGYAVKTVLECPDATPLLLPVQLRFWSWIADYYLCTVGEVCKAALPSGLKIESESVVVRNDDYEGVEALPLSERQVLDCLGQRAEMSVARLQRESGVRNVLLPVRRLLERGALVMKEEVKRTYRPKTVLCTRLSDDFLSEESLEPLFDELKRSPKQRALLATYIEMADGEAALRLHQSRLLREVAKSDLLAHAGVTPAVFAALQKRGVFVTYDKPVERASSAPLPAALTVHPLSAAQQRAADGVRAAFQTHDVCLLHGVTSSGKTEIYIHLIQDVLAQGRQVLYLLPEIVLTTQLTDRLQRVFGARLGIYHSKYPDAERVEVWRKQLSDHPYDIIVGVRSSVFLPFRRLGLVIVDEEHESSFKQQDPAPRYHARNAAIVLASLCGAKTLLGTATPSLESYRNAQCGKYGLVELTTRYRDVQLPEVEVVDVKELQHKRRMNGPFSPLLLAEMRRALDAGEQIILFQNRRGFAPLLECHTCGWVPKCPHCDVSLTYHKGQNRLTCHYCGYTGAVPHTCPSCGENKLTSLGVGTERVEDDVCRIFPESRVARMDLDTTRTRQAYERILDDFRNGRTDVLVGTQMVTKGLDFERVSVVGILNADTLFTLPDFRSYERAFQLMAQVAGRAGRRQARGKVILQTKSPDLPLIGQVVRHDYAGLYADQLEERRLFRYPPFCRLVYCYMKHPHEAVVEALAHEAACLMRSWFADRVLGPDVPPVGRIQQLHIRKMMLKIEPEASLAKVRACLCRVREQLMSDERFRSAQFYFDVDPV